MNKTELTQNVAATSGLSKKETSLVLNALMHVIMSTMQQGGKIMISGFGSFSVREAPARTGHNPRTGAVIRIESKKIVRFRPGSELKITKK